MTEIITFGCRVNSLDSDLLRIQADRLGAKDWVIVNTCTVTAEAERQARQAIRKARRDHPHARLIVTGCAVQRAPNLFANMPEIDFLLGNADKTRLDRILTNAEQRIHISDPAAAQPDPDCRPLPSADGRTRVNLQVQYGCDHRCTFCVVPSVRGPSLSAPPETVRRQMRSLVDAGYQEVVLTGVDLCSYGRDLKVDSGSSPTLAMLVEQLLHQFPEMPRLRLSTLDPAAIDSHLLGLVRDNARLMPHFHLSLQSGDDLILARMGRRHRRDDVFSLLETLKRYRPEAVFGADVIAGFPTETPAMFEATLRLIEDAGFTFLHVFPYSPRPDTPASRMPQIATVERKTRAARLRAAGAAALGRFLDRCIGETESVLVEQQGLGRTERFARIQLSKTMPVGTIVSARVTGREGDVLLTEKREI